MISKYLHSFAIYFQCYYLGGLEESATGILGELSRPLSNSLPADLICEKLKKMDAQICDLRYGKLFSILILYETSQVLIPYTPSILIELI